ncbi:MAG TPA: glycosyltransferase family A protein [Mycobacteriales bacterium]|nr:glycosyltransferase family A protein [Mycobacteriales bacterium]
MTTPIAELVVATPIESAQSREWDGGAAPAVTVVVSTHGRAALLTGLLDALEAQRGVNVEMVVADNGSQDETWSVLTARCADTSIRLLALRLPFHDGPAVPRNTCVALSRAPLVAFTDDDCLPTPAWLAELTAAFDADTEIVQGQTVPEPGGWAGPWGRSLTVTGPTGLYETANLGVRRDAFLGVGGFAQERLLSGRAFGEDVVLGAAIARHGGFRFAPDALVHHRVMPGAFRDFVHERQRLAGFPQLLRHVPELRQRAFARVFLSRRTAITDLALASIPANIITNVETSYSGWASLTSLALVPWFVALWREAGARPGRNRLVRAGQLGYADLAGAAGLLIGSMLARRVLL